MLLIVQAEDLKPAILNTDHLIALVWQASDDSHHRWRAEMTHGRELVILTPNLGIDIAARPGANVEPDHLVRELSSTKFA